MMPELRCLDPECGHRWYEKTAVAEGAECEECGGPTIVAGVDEEPPDELNTFARRLADRSPHPGHARERARRLLIEHRIGAPPVPVHAIARRCGFEVREAHDLGSLRARLLGQVIEVSASEPRTAQRFSVAHELGHHLLGSHHGDGEAAEKEADAFAGELLVPGHMLMGALERTTSTIELARTFQVSRQVLEIAASNHRKADRLT